MTLGELASLIDELRATKSRLKKVALVSAFLRALAPEEILAASAFLAGRPFPASDPRTLDASGALLREAAGGKPSQQKTAPHPTLPFDDPAAATGPVTILDVRTAFDEVASASGPRSRKRKIAALAALFRRVDDRERALVFAIVQASLRTGVSAGLLLEAIASAAAATPDAVRRAALFLGDAESVAHLALTQGAEALSGVTLTPFTPVAPMLAEPADDAHDAWETMGGGRMAVETKYDGVRLQLHKQGERVRIWSRRLTELTEALPEAVVIGEAIPAESVVLDGEVLALGENGRPLPFQETMSRLSRYGDAAVPIVFRFFDCLFVDGRAFVDETYERRRETLSRLIPAALVSEQSIPKSADDIHAYHDRAVAAGHEGVMVKALDSLYEPGRRGKRWLKVKRADTIDCVIIAADRGSGRREGWLSNHHLAVRDESTGVFAPVGKTFKGLTDAEHIAMTKRLRERETGDDGYTVTVRPEIVVEVAYEGIQKSSHLSSGFALRFARVARIRDDKDATQATTLAELRARWDRQSSAPPASGEGQGEW